MIAVYDIFRIWRRVCCHGTWWTAIEDLIYWCGCGVFLFSKMYQENDGIIRTYAMGGILLGTILYHYSISELLVKYVSFCLNKTKDLLKIPYKLIRPLIKRLKFRLLRVKIFLCQKISFQKVRKKKDEERTEKESQEGKEAKKAAKQSSDD